MEFVSPTTVLTPAQVAGDAVTVVVRLGGAAGACYTDYLVWSVVDANGDERAGGSEAVPAHAEARAVVLGALAGLESNSAALPYYDLVLRARNSAGRWWNTPENITAKRRFCVNDRWGPVRPRHPVDEIVFRDRVELEFESVPWSRASGDAFYCSGTDYLVRASDGTATRERPPTVTVVPDSVLRWNVSLSAGTATGPVSPDAAFMNCRGLTFASPRCLALDGTTVRLPRARLRQYAVDWSDVAWNLPACGAQIDQVIVEDWLLRYTKRPSAEEHFLTTRNRSAILNLDPDTWVFSLILVYNDSVIGSFTWSTTFEGLRHGFFTLHTPPSSHCVHFVVVSLFVIVNNSRDLFVFPFQNHSMCVCTHLTFLFDCFSDVAIIVPVCVVGGLALIAGVVGVVFLVRRKMARNEKQGGQQEGGGTELENSGRTQTTPRSAHSEKSPASSKHTGSLEYATSGSGSGSSPQKADTNALTCATYVEFATFPPPPSSTSTQHRHALETHHLTHTQLKRRNDSDGPGAEERGPDCGPARRDQATAGDHQGDRTGLVWDGVEGLH